MKRAYVTPANDNDAGSAREVTIRETLVAWIVDPADEEQTLLTLRGALAIVRAQTGGGRRVDR